MSANETDVIRAESKAMHSAYMAELSSIRADMEHLRGEVHGDMGRLRGDMERRFNEVIQMVSDLRADMERRDAESRADMERRDANAARRETRLLKGVGGIVVGAVAIASVFISLYVGRPQPPQPIIYAVPPPVVGLPAPRQNGAGAASAQKSAANPD